jgi:NADP-dependent 3-hydroxy acid dehydrogenase YdfG
MLCHGEPWRPAALRAHQVTAISPGAVRTEFSNVRYGGDAAKVDAVMRVNRICTSEDLQVQ